MKEIMKGFYNPSEAEIAEAWTSDDTLFVFDTNTLLNLYGYAEQTRNDFYSTLQKIREKIWIPHYVALEYQRNRIRVIKEEKNIFSKINKNLAKIASIVSSDFQDLALQRRFPTLANDTDKLNEDIKKLVESYRKKVDKLDKKQPCVRGDDKTREKLSNYFSGKTGSPPENQNWLDELYKEGKRRYELKYPPGYKDSSKKNEEQPEYIFGGLRYERQYGDLIIWKQIIDKASKDNIKSLIFVTDDSKEDWWEIEESRGEKVIGPRPELTEEILSNSSVEIFTLCRTSEFLTLGGKYLKVNVNSESVNDASIAFSENREIMRDRGLKVSFNSKFGPTGYKKHYIENLTKNMIADKYREWPNHNIEIENAHIIRTLSEDYERKSALLKKLFEGDKYNKLYEDYERNNEIIQQAIEDDKYTKLIEELIRKNDEEEK